MESKNLIPKAFLISNLLDAYQKSGGSPWYESDAIVLAWANWLTALEDMLFKAALISEQRLEKTERLDQLLYQNWRGQDSVIALWNKFCLAFAKERPNYQIAKELTVWQAFLLYRISDKFWNNQVDSKILTASNFFKPRLNFFNLLWNNNPQTIWQELELTPSGQKSSFSADGISYSLTKIDQNFTSYLPLTQQLLSKKRFLRFNLNSWENFWKKSSGGILAQYSSFRLRRAQPFLVQGFNPDPSKRFEMLIGIKNNQQLLIANIERLLAGKEALHVFLWGEPGTGKSSAVFAALDYFKQQNLKLIEISPRQIKFLPQIFEVLQERPEKFILFCDDLILGQNDDSIKLLKTTLDGGLASAPNALLHVTSNRRGLVKRDEMIDEDNSEKNQILDELNSLNDRFGLKLYFEAPRFEKLHDFLIAYAQKHKIKLPDKEKTIIEFKRFCLQNQHNLPAGRTVKQFFDQLNQ